MPLIITSDAISITTSAKRISKHFRHIADAEHRKSPDAHVTVVASLKYLDIQLLPVMYVMGTALLKALVDFSFRLSIAADRPVLICETM